MTLHSKETLDLPMKGPGKKAEFAQERSTQHPPLTYLHLKFKIESQNAFKEKEWLTLKRVQKHSPFPSSLPSNSLKRKQP